MTCREVITFDFKSWNPTLGKALSESGFGKLPLDVITFIASHLSPRDLASLDRVCRTFYIVNTPVVSRNLEVIREAWSRLISLDQFPHMNLPAIVTRETATTFRTNLRGAVRLIYSTKAFQPALEHHKGDLLAAAQELRDKDVISSDTLFDPFDGLFFGMKKNKRGSSN
jgi:hypothetical protein